MFSVNYTFTQFHQLKISCVYGGKSLDGWNIRLLPYTGSQLCSPEAPERAKKQLAGLLFLNVEKEIIHQASYLRILSLSIMDLYHCFYFLLHLYTEWKTRIKKKRLLERLHHRRQCVCEYGKWRGYEFEV